jgi:hypothetical protein
MRVLFNRASLLILRGAWLSGVFLCGAIQTSAAQTPTAVRPIVQQLYNDLALEISPTDGGAVRFGAADATRAVVVTLLPRDVLRWADSAQKMLSARLRRGQKTGHWRSVAEEPGVRSGTMVLSRNIAAADTTLTIFFADGEFNSVETTIDLPQARAFVGAVRRAAQTIQRAAGAKKKPSGNGRDSFGVGSASRRHPVHDTASSASATASATLRRSRQ